MPAQYEAIRDSFVSKGMNLKAAKTKASKIFIAKGKGGTRSSRASSLHDSAAHAIARSYKKKRK